MAAAHPRLLSRWDLPRAAPQHLRYRSAAWRRGTRLCVRVLPASVVPRSRTHSEMPRVTAPPTASLQGKGAPAFCPDPRFQVKSSQVKIQNGGRQSASFGAHRWRDRSGGQISAQPAPLDSPESGHHPHRLVLDHRVAPRLQLCPFLRKSTVQQCKTDPGRRRERSGACVRAVPMGQGVGRAWRPPAPRV